MGQREEDGFGIYRERKPHVTGYDVRMRWAAGILFVLVLLSAAGWVQYRLHESGLYSKSGDESARILLAYSWIKHKWPLQVEVWLPLHKLLIGFAMDVYRDSFVAPRVANGVVGLALILAIGALARVLFRRWDTVFLSLLLAAFFGPRLIISTVPLSEVLLCLTVVLSLTFLAQWMRTRKDWALWASVACMALAMATRYEGWVVAGGYGPLCVFVLARDSRKRIRARVIQSVLVLSSLSVVPLYWAYLWHVQEHSALGFLSASGNRYFALLNWLGFYEITWRCSVINQFFGKTFCR